VTAVARTDVGHTVERLAWGWLAVLHGIEWGPWLRPTKAAGLAGISTSTLRRWADRGVITCLHNGPRRERRYLAEELALVRDVVGHDYTPQLRTLVEHIEELLDGAP
jgi:hypothetical protein